MEGTTTYVHPGFLMKDVFNPIIVRLGVTPVLTVRGRRSGVPHSIPIGRPFDYQGVRYLVSGRGATQWARNLRAAGFGEIRIHGTTTRFRAVEVTGAEHDDVIAAYRETMGRSVERYFRQIPDLAAHPVFRMEWIEQASSTGSRNPS